MIDIKRLMEDIEAMAAIGARPDGGVSREALEAVWRMGQHPKCRGMDIVEIATARKRGLTSEAHTAPSGDGSAMCRPRRSLTFSLTQSGLPCRMVLVSV
jgi:hypothetical protein